MDQVKFGQNFYLGYQVHTKAVVSHQENSTSPPRPVLRGEIFLATCYTVQRRMLHCGTYLLVLWEEKREITKWNNHARDHHFPAILCLPSAVCLFQGNKVYIWLFEFVNNSSIYLKLLNCSPTVRSLCWSLSMFYYSTRVNWLTQRLHE